MGGWKPTPEEQQTMLEQRAAGVPFREIAKTVKRGEGVVELWLLKNAGRVRDLRRDAYHGKAAVHKRLGVYFDISKQEDNGEK